MRVALVMEQCLSSVPGGTGRYAFEVARALAARGGSDVSGWVAWHRRTDQAQVPGVAGPYRLPLPRRPLIAAWERGVGPVPGRSADVVHAPTLFLPPRRRGRPLVVTIHDAVPWTHPETLTPRGVRWHRTMAERAARTADAVVVPSQAVADALREHVHLRRVDVIGHGTTSALSNPPADAADRARRLDLPAAGFLLSLATLEPRKGLDVLLGALAHPAAPDLPLLVVGQPGWGNLDLGRLAAELGIADRVRLMGRLDDADLAVTLAAASVLVVPSRSEGFGLPVVEGMAVGVPVVTSDAAALVEVGGDAVRTAPVGDAAALAAVLRDVVDDRGLRADMVTRGRRRAAGFTWDGAAAQLERLYAEL